MVTYLSWTAMLKRVHWATLLPWRVIAIVHVRVTLSGNPIKEGRDATSTHPLFILCYSWNMIYKIIPQEDDFLEKAYRGSMDDLNMFYGIDWTHNTPKIIIVDDRKTMDLLRGGETEDWVVGWTEDRTVYVLNRGNYEKESNHKYNPEEYLTLIKHELSHLFFSILSGYQSFPIWLNEGFAIYTSGQNKFKKKPTEFSKFLEFYDNGGSGVYAESGFFVQGLIEKFGKQKLLELVKELRNLHTKEKFEEHFSKEYGFNLTYEEINSQKLIS